MEGRLLETILKAGSGVLRPRLVTAGSGGPGHRPPGTMTWLRGARCTDPEAMPGMEARPPAENRHGGAPRGERPASWDAPRLTRADRRVSQTRQQQCACRRSAHPSIGGWTRPQGQTRTQQCAAGTKKRTLFDIVNPVTANGSLRAPRLRTLVSRASAARPGTQGDTSGSCFASFALGPGSRSARARTLATLARDPRSAPDFLR